MKTIRRTNQEVIGSDGGYTLPEVLITMAVIPMIIGAVFMCQYYGLQLHNFVRPKLDNAAYARNALSHLIEEVRCARYLEVGQGTLNTFVASGGTNAQTGNALRIRLAANTNLFIYYFRDASDETLKKVSLGASNAVTIAQAVTNATVFTIENFSGTVLTNKQNNATVGLLLQMRQASARQNVADSYQVRTKITRRAIF